MLLKKPSNSKVVLHAFTRQKGVAMDVINMITFTMIEREERNGERVH